MISSPNIILLPKSKYDNCDNIVSMQWKHNNYRSDSRWNQWEIWVCNQDSNVDIMRMYAVMQNSVWCTLTQCSSSQPRVRNRRVWYVLSHREGCIHFFIYSFTCSFFFHVSWSITQPKSGSLHVVVKETEIIISAYFIITWDWGFIAFVEVLESSCFSSLMW